MLVSIEDFTRREVVVGEYGGQMASFEWVFSPRGADGLPVPMFDRTTGAVDSAVIALLEGALRRGRAPPPPLAGAQA